MKKITIALTCLLASSSLFAKGFSATLLGVLDEKVEVTATDISNEDVFKSSIKRFNRKLNLGSAGTYREVKLYELKNKENKRFWISNLSSNGLRNIDRLKPALASFLLPENTDLEDCQSFESGRSLISDLIQFQSLDSFRRISIAYADFMTKLLPARASANQYFIKNNCIVNEFQNVYHSVSFIDPTPNSAPDALIYMLLVKTTYEE